MKQLPDLSISERRAQILLSIEKAAISNGVDPESICLTGVSKVQPDNRIEAMLATGQRVYGENRVQEAQKRWKDRIEKHPDIQLRLIGPLQTNKSEDAVALFDVIETLDRPKLARSLAKAAEKSGSCPELFIQVNIGQETQKSGVLPSETDAFIKSVRNEYELPLSGLMCIPPNGQPAAPYFTLLKEIANRNGLTQLSMGMSSDFELAIAHGATHVRVGSALFGERVSSH